MFLTIKSNYKDYNNKNYAGLQIYLTSDAQFPGDDATRTRIPVLALEILTYHREHDLEQADLTWGNISPIF